MTHFFAKGCRDLASAVILRAMEDYEDPEFRKDIQHFLFTETFILFCDFARMAPGRIRRQLIHKDCSRCQNRKNVVLCRACWSDKPGNENYNYSERKKR